MVGVKSQVERHVQSHRLPEGEFAGVRTIFWIVHSYLSLDRTDVSSWGSVRAVQGCKLPSNVLRWSIYSRSPIKGVFHYADMYAAILTRVAHIAW